MLVVGYARASTAEQTISPLAQREQIQEWCASNGRTLVCVEADEGVSGTVPMMRREGLQRAIEQMRAHRAGILAVTAVDRLSRDQMESLKIRDTIRRMGGHVSYVAGAGIEDTIEARAMASMLAIFAELERDYIAGRTRAALASRRAAGKRSNADPPYGFCFDGDVCRPCEAESAILRAMVEWRKNGESYERIARRMNQDLETYPARGEKWHTTSVWRILTRTLADDPKTPDNE